MKDAETLTEPLLDDGEGAADGTYANIPPLNPEDPLSGLTDDQIKQSLATFGKNEVSIGSYHVIILSSSAISSHLFTSYAHTNIISCPCIHEHL